MDYRLTETQGLLMRRKVWIRALVRSRDDVECLHINVPLECFVRLFCFGIKIEPVLASRMDRLYGT